MKYLIPLLMLAFTAGCGSRAGLDISTTPPVTVLLLSSALQTDDVIDQVGREVEVFQISSESMQSRGAFKSRTEYSNSFHVVGDKGDLLVEMTLKSRNDNDFELTSFDMSEPTEEQRASKVRNKVDFSAVTFGPRE